MLFFKFLQYSGVSSWAQGNNAAVFTETTAALISRDNSLEGFHYRTGGLNYSRSQYLGVNRCGDFGR